MLHEPKPQSDLLGRPCRYSIQMDVHNRRPTPNTLQHRRLALPMLCQILYLRADAVPVTPRAAASLTLQLALPYRLLIPNLDKGVRCSEAVNPIILLSGMNLCPMPCILSRKLHR